jgi:hypothetical protein
MRSSRTITSLNARLMLRIGFLVFVGVLGVRASSTSPRLFYHFFHSHNLWVRLFASCFNNTLSAAFFCLLVSTPHGRAGKDMQTFGLGLGFTSTGRGETCIARRFHILPIFGCNHTNKRRAWGHFTCVGHIFCIVYGVFT